MKDFSLEYDRSIYAERRVSEIPGYAFLLLLKKKNEVFRASDIRVHKHSLNV
jgi:hypothetical protein